MLIIHILRQSTKLMCNSAWITWFQHITRRCLQLLPPNSLLRQRWQRLLKRLPRLRSGWRKYGSASTKNTLSGNRCSAISLKTRPSGRETMLLLLWFYRAFMIAVLQTCNAVTILTWNYIFKSSAAVHSGDLRLRSSVLSDPVVQAWTNYSLPAAQESLWACAGQYRTACELVQDRTACEHVQDSLRGHVKNAQKAPCSLFIVNVMWLTVC